MASFPLYVVWFPFFKPSLYSIPSLWLDRSHSCSLPIYFKCNMTRMQVICICMRWCFWWSTVQNSFNHHCWDTLIELSLFDDLQYRSFQSFFFRSLFKYQSCIICSLWFSTRQFSQKNGRSYLPVAQRCAETYPMENWRKKGFDHLYACIYSHMKDYPCLWIGPLYAFIFDYALTFSYLHALKNVLKESAWKIECIYDFFSRSRSLLPSALSISTRTSLHKGFVMLLMCWYSHGQHQFYNHRWWCS